MVGRPYGPPTLVLLAMVVEACRLVRFLPLLCVPAASGATPTELRGASAHCAGAAAWFAPHVRVRFLAVRGRVISCTSHRLRSVNSTGAEGAGFEGGGGGGRGLDTHPKTMKMDSTKLTSQRCLLKQFFLSGANGSWPLQKALFERLLGERVSQATVWAA